MAGLGLWRWTQQLPEGISCIRLISVFIPILTRMIVFVSHPTIWRGGTPNQTTLAKCFMNKVKVHDLETILEPLSYNWKRKRKRKRKCQRGESFGEFTTRMGIEKLQEIVEKWEGLVKATSHFNLKPFADKETYEAMNELAKHHNKNAHQLALEVIRNFVVAQQKMARPNDIRLFERCKII